MRSCPFCAEAIQDAAIVCRFCGRDVPPGSLRGGGPEQVLAYLLRGAEIVFGVVAVVGVAYMVLGRIGRSPSPQAGAAPAGAALLREAEPPPPPYVLSLLESELVDLPPGEHFDTTFSVRDPHAHREERPCVFTARVQGVEGGNRDVEVYLLDEGAYRDWHDGVRPTPMYASGRTSSASLQVPLPGTGPYSLLVSNRYSFLMGKTVRIEEARVRCQAADGPRDAG